MVNVLRAVIIAVGVLSQSCIGALGGDDCSRFGFEMKMMERMVILEQKKSETETLKEKQQVLENQNTELVETMERQRKEQEAKNENTALQIEKLTKKQEDLGNEEAKLVKMEKELDEQHNLHMEIHKNQTLKMEHLKTMIIEQGKIIAKNAPGPVIVHVRLPSNNAALRSGQRVVFYSVVDNIGNAYNTGTGRFTAPTKGTYLISVKMCFRKRDNLMLAIMKGHSSISEALMNSEYDNACETNVEVIQLAVGEYVWVKITDASYLAPPGIGDSSFTVVLINNNYR